MIGIKKPIVKLPLFIVLNYEQQMQQEDLSRLNSIILNSLEVDELIEQLSKDKEKSRNFHYWLCLINDKNSIDSLRKLVHWMEKEGFNYHITDEQLKMYHKAAIEI